MENIAYIRRQPVVFEFENLFKGHYYPRRARIYYNYEEEGALCFVEDVRRPTNIIPYAVLLTPTYNEFLVDPDGKILECKYPEKTIPVDGPVGLNVFDTLFPEYIKPVRMTINKVLAKEIELPIEYTFSVKGEIRHKVGTIKPRGDNVLFCVRRIAKAQKKIYNCRCG